MEFDFGGALGLLVEPGFGPLEPGGLRSGRAMSGGLLSLSTSGWRGLGRVLSAGVGCAPVLRMVPWPANSLSRRHERSKMQNAEAQGGNGA
jgi:hypothetical protein